MGLTLTRFGQEVDVATGTLDVAFFAIFQTEDGRELKLPISENASQVLIGFFADAKEKQAEVPAELRLSAEEGLDDDRRLATTFSLSTPEDPLVEYEEETEETDDAPDSEDDVPTL